ncbi:hypothetical protein FOS14_18700 [Skermania sp. ID1734]|nr:transglycosylase SLT domain-containing protein [Skermania sp. ID1734]TSD95385.1 hypothetical protein FOS14_18700 [Skermania sp. ID1734]
MSAAYAAGAASLALASVATIACTGAAGTNPVEPAAYVQKVAPPAVSAAPSAPPVVQAVAKAVPAPAPVPPPAPVYPDNLDGWIRQALDILHAHNIPASYDGIMRNVMRESTGNPQAINLYDSNAAAGIPSKGLLQVIDPTFAAFHIDGTAWNIYDPVANIVAACNYAANRYGSIDNVDSAY